MPSIVPGAVCSVPRAVPGAVCQVPGSLIAYWPSSPPAGPASRPPRGKRRLAYVTDLIDTTEMYLRTVFELEEEGVVPLRAQPMSRTEEAIIGRYGTTERD